MEDTRLNIVAELITAYFASNDPHQGSHFGLVEEFIPSESCKYPGAGVAFFIANFISAVIEPEQAEFFRRIECWLQRVAYRVTGTHWPLQPQVLIDWAKHCHGAVINNQYTPANVVLCWFSIGESEGRKVIQLQYLCRQAARTN